MARVKTKAGRSRIMSAIRSKNTRPELLVRRALWKAGYRFRTHARNLPGKPDLVFSRKQTVVFVHGCFWHMHSEPGCPDSKLPVSRREYWIPKLMKNVERDRRNEQELSNVGWNVITIWECETKEEAYFHKLLQALGPRARAEPRSALCNLHM